MNYQDQLQMWMKLHINSVYEIKSHKKNIIFYDIETSSHVTKDASRTLARLIK